jgi:choline dehydrogenase-like flavoprotein
LETKFVLVPLGKLLEEGRQSMLVGGLASLFRCESRFLTAIGGWVRGDRIDYDAWGKQVGDARWSYSGILPYFRKIENHHTPYANPKEHGFEGPIYTSSVTSSGRNYPLRDMVKAAWEAIGLEQIPDANSGSPQGFADLNENRRNGKRQLATDAYPLDGIKVLTDTLVKRVIVEQNDGRRVATAVELASGEVLTSRKEIIISAGAYRTPQVLLLSGIGSPAELKKHAIEQVVDLAEVGKNLHDHLGIPQRLASKLPA